MIVRLAPSRRQLRVEHEKDLISNGRTSSLRRVLTAAAATALLAAMAVTVNPAPASASAACTWRTVQTKYFASNNAWLKLRVNGCGKTYMQAWWPVVEKTFKCSIYSESGQNLNTFTVTARGCTSNQISVGSKKIYAFVWVTDPWTGKFLATANTGFYRAD